MQELKSTQDKEAVLNPKLLSKFVIKLLKQDISKRYKETREITGEDWEFCEAIDWHPVDELPMKEEYEKELKERQKGPHSEMTIKELDKLMKIK
ncbi:hypothetical protein GOV12_00830 [Candidatus Pacearchaeota archaeon]|nr:hypothetical protein [Candidatus Pacearchaeota archaeon]